MEVTKRGTEVGSCKCLMRTVLGDTFCRFMDALFYAVDGNFHANMKEKPHDVEDTPLSKGAGYFADEDAFAAFAETLGPIEPEVNQPASSKILLLMADSFSRVRATSSRQWVKGHIGGKCPGQWVYSVRDTCSHCREATSIYKKVKGK